MYTYVCGPMRNMEINIFEHIICRIYTKRINFEFMRRILLHLIKFVISYILLERMKRIMSIYLKISKKHFLQMIRVIILKK